MKFFKKETPADKIRNEISNTIMKKGAMTAAIETERAQLNNMKDKLIYSIGAEVFEKRNEEDYDFDFTKTFENIADLEAKIAEKTNKINEFNARYDEEVMILNARVQALEGNVQTPQNNVPQFTPQAPMQPANVPQAPTQPMNVPQHAPVQPANIPQTPYQPSNVPPVVTAQPSNVPPVVSVQPTNIPPVVSVQPINIPQEVTPQPIANQVAFCENCGKQIAEGDVFCQYCGTKIQ